MEADECRSDAYLPLRILCVTLATSLSTFRYLLCKMGLTVPVSLLRKGRF